MSVRVILICLVLGVMGCVTEKDEPVVSLGPGDAVPQFSVPLDDGTVFGNADMQRTPCVIVFFDTSCPDCRAALPVVDEVASRKVVTSRGIRFVAIARTESEATIAQFWQEASLTLPYSAQPDDRVYRLFANRIIPRIYITTPSASGAPVIASVFVEGVEADALLSALLALPQS